MNPSRNTFWLAGAFLVCILVGGSILWRGSYTQYLNAKPPWIMFAVMASVAVFLSWMIGLRIKPTALVIGSSLPATIIVRIFLDCFADPTNHNLWPFELLIAIATGMIVAFPSAGIGWILRRLTNAGPKQN